MNIRASGPISRGDDLNAGQGSRIYFEINLDAHPGASVQSFCLDPSGDFRHFTNGALLPLAMPRNGYKSHGGFTSASKLLILGKRLSCLPRAAAGERLTAASDRSIPQFKNKGVSS